MNAQAAVRARTASQQLARRGFHSSRAQFASPFHYPEGPRSNLPFNTQTRFFAFRYWTFMGRSQADMSLAGDELTMYRCRLRHSLRTGRQVHCRRGPQSITDQYSQSGKHTKTTKQWIYGLREGWDHGTKAGIRSSTRDPVSRIVHTGAINQGG